MNESLTSIVIGHELILKDSQFYFINYIKGYFLYKQ